MIEDSNAHACVTQIPSRKQPAIRAMAYFFSPLQKILSAALAGGAGIYIWYYLYYVCQQPALYFKEGKLSELVLNHCTLLRKKYRPTIWAVNPHIQTVLSALRTLTCRAMYDRQPISTTDGGTVALDWFQPRGYAKLPADTPVVLVLHGLTGGSREGYCKWMCTSIAQKGWRPVVLNYRGCAGLQLTSPAVYCASFTDDVHLAVQEIQTQFPEARVFAAGYSLGSLILCKYLAECGNGTWKAAGSGISSAVMVSNPFCMHTSKVRASKPWSIEWLYNIGLAHRIKRYIVEHNLALSKHAELDMASIAQSTTIEHLDERVVCKLYGFEAAEDYYAAASSMQYIPQIQTPCLFLIAQDDPFLGKLPIEECMSNENTVLAVTLHGGHVAFLKGLWPFGTAWMDQVAIQFLTMCSDMTSQNQFDAT
ncbi:hypothetical protein ABBQ32_011990 [Trebouxia sp. C0010 RCD-2024]